MNKLKSKKVAFITGASGGIGRSVVERFMQADYFIYGIDMSTPKDKYSDQKYKHHLINITDFASLVNIFENEMFSSSENVLVNCAGIREICSIKELSLELWEKIFAVNVTATFVAAKHFCQKLVESNLNGSVVNIASVSGLLGEPNRTAYVSSKHAVIGLTKQLSIEYGNAGVRVNTIAPGVIRTPLTEEYYEDPTQMEKIVAGQFIKNQGMPSDVAEASFFLASDQAKFITGSTLVVDGGWTAGKNL
jgi:NAD(P)-dependent dehydrogenase (short-subunit alcohol dehydrogenase family)